MRFVLLMIAAPFLQRLHLVFYSRRRRLSTKTIVYVENKDISIVNDLLVDDEIDSLLYFGDFNVLDEAYDARKAELSNAL